MRISRLPIFHPEVIGSHFAAAQPSRISSFQTEKVVSDVCRVEHLDMLVVSTHRFRSELKVYSPVNFLVTRVIQWIDPVSIGWLGVTLLN